MALIADYLRDKINNIKLLALDVDGVLTTGQLTYSSSGEELKSFNTQDGLGLKLLRDSGLELAIITRRVSPPLRLRLDELNITNIYDGQLDKGEALTDLMQKTGLNADAIAYAGDDIPDIVVMKQVGFAIAVANARQPVPQYAHWITQAQGGQGAVREMCELIMDTQDTWNLAIEYHL